MKMVACVRYGKDLATTIGIMVDGEKRLDTADTEKGIQSLLDKRELTAVRISFEQGRMVRGGAGSTGYVDPHIFTRPSFFPSVTGSCKMASSSVKHIRPVPKTDRIYKLWPGILRTIINNTRLPGV
jgi:hypothetical protein